MPQAPVPPDRTGDTATAAAPTAPAGLDPSAKRRVERAAAALRAGEGVVLLGESGGLLVQAVETAGPDAAAALSRVTGTAPRVAVTAARARALDLEVPAEARAVLLRPAASAPADLMALADPGTAAERGLPEVAGVRAGDATTARALALAKLARLLPAVLVAPLPESAGADADARRAWAAARDLAALPAAEIAAYRAAAAADLHPVADARVPLAGAEDAWVHAFRPRDGGPEHFAIVIGRPSPERPVLTRLHSECFTGDLLGSLRCDCGDQLRGAIDAIARAGGGVLLYLAQEGRGIGLVNKLRAYRLQDAGADTLEANTALGFDADERIYLPAAQMLRHLGFDRVRLLTNNPDKVTALATCGLEVVERVPHHFPSNDHNELYLNTKARRFGHMY